MKLKMSRLDQITNKFTFLPLLDIQGCEEGSCFEGVPCLDVPAPGTGFTCGPCPTGYHGDGATCVPIGRPLPANTAVTFNS